MSMQDKWQSERDGICGGMTERRGGFERYDEDDGRDYGAVLQTHVHSQVQPDGEVERVATVDQAMTGLDASGHSRFAGTPEALGSRMASVGRTVSHTVHSIAAAINRYLNDDND